MKNWLRQITVAGLCLLFGTILFVPRSAFAHCDGMDGPVVIAAQRALEKNNVNLVLIWVQKNAEPEIRTAFRSALDARKAHPQSHEATDLKFFETLVRLHRKGEGEEFTGLKPAGRDLGPIIPAADKAVETGSLDALLPLLPEKAHAGMRTAFQRVMVTKKFDENDVPAGRKFVKAYVTFLHQAEETTGAGHPPDTKHPEE